MSLNGMGTELSIIALSAIFVKDVMKPLIMRIPAVQKMNGKNGKGNPNGKPGFTKECRIHGEKLVELDTSLGLLREDVKRIENKL